MQSNDYSREKHWRKKLVFSFHCTRMEKKQKSEKKSNVISNLIHFNLNFKRLNAFRAETLSRFSVSFLFRREKGRKNYVFAFFVQFNLRWIRLSFVVSLFSKCIFFVVRSFVSFISVDSMNWHSNFFSSLFRRTNNFRSTNKQVNRIRIWNEFFFLRFALGNSRSFLFYLKHR